MAQYTFKSFQGEYPDDAACLKAVMVSQFGGTWYAVNAAGNRIR